MGVSLMKSRIELMGSLNFSRSRRRGLLRRKVESEIKNGARAGLPFGPHPPAMPGNDPPDDRQANSGAFEFLCGMQSLKDAKKFVGVLHVESGAVVLHEKDRAAILLATEPDFDFRDIAQASVFHRVS